MSSDIVETKKKKGKLVISSSNKKSGRRRRKAASARRRRRVAFSPLAIIIFVVIVLVAGVGGGYAIWYNSFTDVRLSDYSSVTLAGYDKHGTASLDVLGETEYAEFFRTVSASLDMTENLSNGDELTVSYVYDEEIAKNSKLRVDDTDAHIKVEGLIDTILIDHNKLFSGAELSFDGMSPCMLVSVENTSEDPFISQVEYTIEGDKIFYEGGTTVLVNASIPEELYEDPAYSIEVSDADKVQEYTTPIGDSYITDANQISDEMLSILEQEGLNIITKSDAKEYGLRIFQHEVHIKPVFVGNTTTFRWVNPYVLSAYFHSITEDGKKSIDNHANDVQIVYGVTLTQQDGQSCSTEVVIQFANLVQCEDGTTNLNLESGRIISASHRDANVKKLVTGDSDGAYETTKLTE